MNNKEGSTQAPIRHAINFNHPDFLDEKKLDEESKRALIQKEKHENSQLRVKDLEQKIDELERKYETTITDLDHAVITNVQNSKKYERDIQLTKEHYLFIEEKRKNNIVRSFVNQNSRPTLWFKKKDPLPFANALGETDKAGYLSKQGDWVRSWRRKWMVLKADKIYVFDSPQDEKPKTQIDLTFDCFVQRADEYTNMEFSFGIYSNIVKKQPNSFFSYPFFRIKLFS